MRPLAERLRPRHLDHFFGQDHLIGKNGSLRQMIQSNQVASMIFWGPPGVGKTSLALQLAAETDRRFFSLSAVNSGVKQVREAIESAKKSQFFGSPSAILFIDEIHRFSKSQQDSLLKVVEEGDVVLIGATTENPSFEVNAALLSRCQVFTLKAIDHDTMLSVIEYALKTDEELKARDIEVQEADNLIRFAGGDIRKLYNGLEVLAFATKSDEKLVIDNEVTRKILSDNLSRYDKNGEQHYDIISAFIKSIRGSDPQAAVYWLARMIEGGEDPKFICRRMVISASEDIGLSNPNALLMANSCFQAVQNLGMPEGRIPMSQCAIYLACSPKGNSAYMAINRALQYIKQNPNEPVPLHLRNAPTKLMKDMNYGAGYKYAHDYDDHYIEQQHLPDSAAQQIFFEPSEQTEAKYAQFLKNKRQK